MAEDSTSAQGQGPEVASHGQEDVAENGEAGEGGTPAEQKSDDEILAEALERFGRGSQPGAEAGGAQAESGSAGTGTGPEAEAGDAVVGAGSTPAAQAGGAVAGQPLTDGEKAALLDRELARKFAEFDELMLGEREALAQQRKGNAGDSGGGGGAYGAGGLGDGDGMPETAMADPGGAAANAGGSPGVPGSGDNNLPADIPADIGSANDDDIIARQLREAAIKEQDPALRAKLWDEYRKYKRGGP